jgi:hypothetical protein
MKLKLALILALSVLAASLVYGQAVTRLGSPARELQLAERSYLTYSPRSYTGTRSFQPIGIDLTMAAAAGRNITDGTSFIAPGMGHLIGTNVSKTGTYQGGWIGMYDVQGTNASHLPKGGLLGLIADGTTTANCAVCAVLDGDSAVTRAAAAFGVDHLNSTNGSGFDYGVDLFKAGHDGFDAANYSKGDLRLSNEIVVLSGAGAPTDGTSGTGVGNAGPGSLYIDRTAGKLYINTNTKASPTWVVVGAQT